MTVLTRQEEALTERLRLVEGDRVAMDGILSDVDVYETRMKAELSRYQAQIENVLLQMERRVVLVPTTAPLADAILLKGVPAPGNNSSFFIEKDF